MLKGSLKTGLVGSAIPEALLEYIRANDSVVLDGCDKVRTNTVVVSSSYVINMISDSYLL